MASAAQNKQEQFVAGTPGYLNNLSDYRHDYKAILRSPSALPFFVEMIDQFNNPVSLPWPPDNGKTTESEDDRRVLGIKFIVNPASISINMSKIINRTQSMTGWIEEHWGEEIDTVTFTGSSAAFVTGRTLLRNVRQQIIENSQDRAQARADLYSAMGFSDNPLVDQDTRVLLDTSPGLTVRHRRSSLSYEQMRDLVKIFAANGCLFDNQGFVKDRAFIKLSFDYSSYLGYFESIDITEDATVPFRFTYTITFKAEKTEYKFLTRNAVNSHAGRTV
jgi:hypothetical protein